MGRISTEAANAAMDGFKEELQMIEGKIEKNFRDMDLENADVQLEIEDIVGEMKKRCEELIEYIDSAKGGKI